MTGPDLLGEATRIEAHNKAMEALSQSAMQDEETRPNHRPQLNHNQKSIPLPANMAPASDNEKNQIKKHMEKAAETLKKMGQHLTADAKTK